MVRINEKGFDWKTINDIYEGPDGVVQSVSEIIETIANSTSNALTLRILQEWFFVGGLVSTQKISEFLLSRTPKQWIERYARTVCEHYWGNESLYNIFLGYESVARDAAQPDISKEKRLEIITTLLNPAHFHEGMFEVKRSSSDDSYRELKMSDLEMPIKYGALCASHDRIKSLRLTHYSEIEESKSHCESIFDYNGFRTRYRNQVLAALGISVCPYCNRQYISSWGNDQNSTADIDHFYNKDRFPFLALSLFNFVPSCQICNSRFKQSEDFYIAPHVNPHSTSFGQNARFEIGNIQSVMDLGVVPELKLYVRPGFPAIDNSVRTFHIEDLYQNHRDYAREIAKKAVIFGRSQLEEYYNQYEGLFESIDELNRTVYGNYLAEEDQGKRPLSKLTQDLLYDLLGEDFT